MTPEQKATLHRILLDAEAGIKDGRLYGHDGVECDGICRYVGSHIERVSGLYTLTSNLYKQSPLYNGGLWVAEPFDFSHPDRLALLDYLIESTKS